MGRIRRGYQPGARDHAQRAAQPPRTASSAKPRKGSQRAGISAGRAPSVASQANQEEVNHRPSPRSATRSHRQGAGMSQQRGSTRARKPAHIVRWPNVPTPSPILSTPSASQAAATSPEGPRARPRNQTPKIAAQIITGTRRLTSVQRSRTERASGAMKGSTLTAAPAPMTAAPRTKALRAQTCQPRRAVSRNNQGANIAPTMTMVMVRSGAPGCARPLRSSSPLPGDDVLRGALDIQEITAVDVPDLPVNAVVRE